MRFAVYRLSSTGAAVAASPSADWTKLDQRVLGYFRKRGGVATAQQVIAFVGDEMTARVIINGLLRGPSPRIVEVTS